MVNKTNKEELEKIKDNAEVGVREPLIEKEDRSEKFVKAILHNFFDEVKDRKKAYITVTNERGILKAHAINEYLENNFGIHNRILSKLELSKIEISLSVKGKGIEKVIQFAEAFGYYLEDTSEEGLGKIGRLMRRR